jgi:heat shock 70kDa protein 1/2/6/8
MVQEAEKFKAEDEAVRAKVDSRNGLESYLHQVKNSLDEEKIKEKIEEEDR